MGVIGFGYVGQPVAVSFTQTRFPVVGFDVDARRVHAVNAAGSYIGDGASSDIAAMVAGGKLRACTS